MRPQVVLSVWSSTPDGTAPLPPVDVGLARLDELDITPEHQRELQTRFDTQCNMAWGSQEIPPYIPHYSRFRLDQLTTITPLKVNEHNSVRDHLFLHVKRHIDSDAARVFVSFMSHTTVTNVGMYASGVIGGVPHKSLEGNLFRTRPGVHVFPWTPLNAQCALQPGCKTELQFRTVRQCTSFVNMEQLGQLAPDAATAVSESDSLTGPQVTLTERERLQERRHELLKEMHALDLLREGQGWINDAIVLEVQSAAADRLGDKETEAVEVFWGTTDDVTAAFAHTLSNIEGGDDTGWEEETENQRVLEQLSLAQEEVSTWPSTTEEAMLSDLSLAQLDALQTSTTAFFSELNTTTRRGNPQLRAAIQPIFLAMDIGTGDILNRTLGEVEDTAHWLYEMPPDNTHSEVLPESGVPEWIQSGLKPNWIA
ncbi:hypothetical protein KIPB_006139, partial [Kipferlia bialata]|eukprot:g6139.t1